MHYGLDILAQIVAILLHHVTMAFGNIDSIHIQDLIRSVS